MSRLLLVKASHAHGMAFFFLKSIRATSSFRRADMQASAIL